MIEFQCECGKRMKAKPELAGKSVRCPKCQAKVNVPAAMVVAPVSEPDTVPETFTIPAPSATVPPPLPEIDEEFAAYDGEQSDSEEAFDELPPIPRPQRNDAVNQHEILQASGDPFFRHFFAVWWCSLVLRIVGIILYLGAGISFAIMVLAIVGLFMAGDKETPAGLQAFGGAAILALWLPAILILITLGSIFYAAAQLITAQCWRYLQHGIGGGGLL